MHSGGFELTKLTYTRLIHTPPGYRWVTHSVTPMPLLCLFLRLKKMMTYYCNFNLFVPNKVAAVPKGLGTQCS